VSTGAAGKWMTVSYGRVIERAALLMISAAAIT
jgi:hypothetical protein